MDKPYTVYNILHEIFKTLIFSRIWVALCVLGYTQTSFLLFDGEPQIHIYAIMLMLGGYVLYVLPFLYFSLVKKVTKAYTDRQRWIQGHLPRFYVTSAVVILILCVLGLFNMPIFFRLVLHGVVVGIVTVLYELPLIPLPHKKRLFALREMGLIKPVILTFVWWYLGAYGIAQGWATIGDVETGITPTQWALLGIQFVFMLILCVLFDVRDCDIDAPRNIITWPVRWGIKNTNIILIVLSIVGIAASWGIDVPLFIRAANTLSFAMLIFYSSGAIKKTTWWFHDFAVDGMMLLQWGLLYLFYVLL